MQDLTLLYDKMTATVLIKGTETQHFTISTAGMRHCTDSLHYMLFLVRDRLPCGVEIDYRIDERLFNLSRLKAKTKVTKMPL